MLFMLPIMDFTKVLNLKKGFDALDAPETLPVTQPFTYK